MKKILLALLAGIILIWGCSDDTDPEIVIDNYDREAMLANWADNIIIPSYAEYTTKLTILVSAKDNFLTEQSESNLSTLKQAWLNAYIAWQSVAMFEIGKAETLGLRGYTNIYPTNSAEIEENIRTGTYNLELSSLRDSQGFPALDYMLYGAASDQEALLIRYQQEPATRDYLDQLITRLNDMGQAVYSDWTSGYRDEFVANSGSDGGSSVNKLVNDFMLYYESSLRAGKVGIPAGVFSGTPLSDKVEGIYSKIYSKMLLKEALKATRNFFNGKHYGSDSRGESLHSYLDFLNTVNEGEQVSALINGQFEQAAIAIDALDADLSAQVENDNNVMLEAYNELQKNVVLLKVDMFQALNIRVAYTDADGD